MIFYTNFGQLHFTLLTRKMIENHWKNFQFVLKCLCLLVVVLCRGGVKSFSEWFFVLIWLKMQRFTYNEYADMHLVYGRAECNGRRAAGLYRAQFPGRHVPHHSTFSQVDRRLRESGKFKPKKEASGAPRTVRTVDFTDRVLEEFANRPRTSTRLVASELNTTQSSVWRVMKELGQHPFHIQKVQSLQPEDYAPRLEFAEWYLDRQRRSPAFASNILWTDEACFARDGFFNVHNSHIWSDENPHAVEQVRSQWQFSVNVWAGLVSNYVIGPYLLPARLTGEAYATFIEDVLPELLEDVPYDIRQNMLFMHDGAPPHFSRVAREYLNANFPGRWIGRLGPIAWPPRSPDMTPLDFFVWGHVKSLVYETPVNNVEELVARIILAFDDIREHPAMFPKIRRSTVKRYNLCVNHGGRHFENYL